MLSALNCALSFTPPSSYLRPIDFSWVDLAPLMNLEGLSQEALALKVGISTSSIARIETGKINTTISTAMHIAEKIEVPFTDLFDF